MKILKWLLITVLVLALALVAFLWYMGVFSTPKVTEMQMGPYTLVYEEYTGPYSSVGPIMDRVYKGVKAEGIETTKGFGIYLNNPNNTDPSKLQSHLGCIIETKDLNQVYKLRKKFKVAIFRKANCLVAEFPIRNNLSYMVGPLKVYPEMNKALAAKNYKMGNCMELYDMPAKKIFFIFEIAK